MTNNNNLKTINTREVFVDVKGYEGMYQISNLGRLKSLSRERFNGHSTYFTKEKMLSQSKNNKGYKTVTLCKENKLKTFTLHRLVAVAFLNHTPNGNTLVIDHQDNNKSNNTLANLQIITNRENCSKDKKNGSSIYTGVSFHIRVKKWCASIFMNGKLKHLGYFTDELDAAREYQRALQLAA